MQVHRKHHATNFGVGHGVIFFAFPLALAKKCSFHPPTTQPFCYGCCHCRYIHAMTSQVPSARRLQLLGHGQSIQLDVGASSMLGRFLSFLMCSFYFVIRLCIGALYFGNSIQFYRAPFILMLRCSLVQFVHVSCTCMLCVRPNAY